MSTFSRTGGSTAATAFRAFSNRLPKVLMASRIVGLFSASCVSSIDRIMDWTPRVIAAPILSKVAPQLAPASLAAPDRDGNRDVPVVMARFIVLMKSMAESSPSLMICVTSEAVTPMASAYISMAGMPAFSSISMCSMVTLPFVCILLSASVTEPKAALEPSP